jgi:crotonobetainyl-CoA:carnitine CoA-transferase CaiB-like acyl-CoA transferase
MGFDEARLKALKPDLVYCNLNGYGTSGPYAGRPAFDFVAQAMSGFMSDTGDAEDPPLRAGPPVSDLIAGLYAALGILAAVMRRDRTGKGEQVSVSLLSSLVSFLSFQAANFLASGELPARTGNDHTIVAPYGLFRTADGKVAIAPSTEEFYQRLLDALELGELRQNPDFLTNELRVGNRAAINAAVEAKTCRQSTEHWIELLNAAGVPCGRVQNLREVFSDPQILDQKMLLTVDHPGHGAISMLGFPVKFANEPCQVRRPAPDLGADSDEILRGLGLTPDDIAALRGKGVV